MTALVPPLRRRRLLQGALSALLWLCLAPLVAGAVESESDAPSEPVVAPDRMRIVGASATKLRNQALRTGPGGSGAIAALPAVPPEVLALGRSIYLDGLGEGGRPIMGLRFGGVEARGAAVACASCHRRSGLGAIEGVDQVSPIAGRFIFTDDPRAVVSMNYRNIHSFNQRHEPFNAGTFRAAVTQGRHLDGRELSPIMPRYEFSEAELTAVQGYLQTLSAQWSPGVTATQLRLATVITPDVSPERRAVFLNTIRAAIDQKNGNFVPGQRTMSAAEMLFRSDRFWELDVWELKGSPSTWGAQLDARSQANPVFALVSGLGAGEWGPVHQFCERTRTPCWFPSVDAPPAAARKDFYSVYFSAGVSLEADVLAARLNEGGNKPARVVQMHCGDAAGRAGALRLDAVLHQHRQAPKTATREVHCGDAGSVRRAMAEVRADDALMLWWPASAVTTLQDVAPPRASAVYASSRLLGSTPELLPASWKPGLQLLYLYQAPEKRHATLFYFESWLKIRKLALSDEVLQSEVYFAMSYLAETLTEMIDNLHREYLLERAENSLSLREGQKAEDEARETITAKYHRHEGGAQGAMARMANPAADTRTPRPLPGKPAQLNIKREGTTVYPRLSLAQGQRFASKGAYLMRFGADPAGALEPVSEWIIP